MVENAGNVGNNQHYPHNQHNQHNNHHEQHNGNEVNHIPRPPTIEGLHQMIQQLQDQNRRLATHMAVMNRENNRRENEASSQHHNDGSVRDEEENNTHKTRGREETDQINTKQGPPIYSELFSEFIMSIALPENFQLPNTLKPYDGTRDPQLHLTMFRSMMLVNGASDPILYRTFPTLEKVASSGSPPCLPGLSTILLSYRKLL